MGHPRMSQDAAAELPTPRRYLSAAEADVLEALLAPELTPDMREVALCLYEAQAMGDARCGQRQPDADWRAVLTGMARLAVVQLLHLAREIGGRAVYLAKGVAVRLSARDRELCGKFRGNNYAQLAAEYDLTEMRVRQIIGAWRLEQFERRQGRLPGLDDDAG